MDIDKWTHVFVQDDSVRGPLVAPYKGPFHILAHLPKTFKLDIYGRTESVSIERLKRAFHECDSPSADDSATPTFNPLQPLRHMLSQTTAHSHVQAPLTPQSPATPLSLLQPNKSYVTRAG